MDHAFRFAVFKERVMKKHNNTNRKLVGRRQRRNRKCKPLTEEQYIMFMGIESIWRDEDKRILEMMKNSSMLYVTSGVADGQ